MEAICFSTAVHALLCAVSEIVLHRLMKCICQFRHTFSLKIDKAVDTLYFPEKTPSASLKATEPIKPLYFIVGHRNSEGSAARA